MKRLLFAVLALVAGCDDRTVCAGADCVPTLPPGLRYAVELTPPMGSPLVHEQFPDLITDADGTAALTFDAPAILTGRVYLGDAASPSISARISAVPANDPTIPGHALLFATTSTASVSLGGTSYRLPVAPGSYNLFVTPTSPDGTPAPDKPPIVLPVTVTGDRMLDLVLPTDLFHVTGRVFDSSGAGVSNMSVHVEQSGRVVSTAGTTDVTGGFDVVMPRAAGMYTLHATPQTNSQVVAPALEQPLAIDGTSAAAQAIMRLPAYQAPKTYHFIITARTMSGLRAPVAGAQLTFTTTISDPDATPATFVANATTDLLGTADVVLIQGLQYTLSVQTSPSSEDASALMEHYSLDTDILYVELGLKTEVTGTLTGADGKPVAGAVVSAIGVSQTASQNTASTSPTGAGTAQTDMQGRFRVLLDPGTYDLEAQPQDGSPYPRWALQGLVVGNDPPSPVAFQLPGASRITGRVSGPDGKPQEADVKVYLVTQFGGMLAGRVRGQAHAGTDGSFSLLLANPQLPNH